jgi:hypothetical protein
MFLVIHRLPFVNLQLKKLQAQEKLERENLKRLADEEATLAHQLNMFHSELLTEVTDATSVNGPFRIGKDRFKGYTPEMIKTIREEQLRQAQDKKRREEQEKQMDVAWDKMSRKYAIATTILDKELADRKRYPCKPEIIGITCISKI